MAICPILLASEAVGDAGTWLANIPQGKYEAFAVILNSVSSAGQIMTEAVCGRLRVSEGGRDVVNLDFAQLGAINRLKGGKQHLNWNTADICDGVWIIPRGFYDDNVHRVLETDLAQLTTTHGATWATVVETATWRLYGLIRQTGEMRYNLRINQVDLKVSSPGTFSYQIRDENTVAIYLNKHANVDNVRIMQDNELAVNVVRSEDAENISTLLNNTDSLTAVIATESYGGAMNSIAEFQLANPGEIGEFLSDDVLIELTAALANDPTTIIVFSADFSPTKLQETKYIARSVMQRKMARKNTLARTRPLQALRVAAEG